MCHAISTAVANIIMLLSHGPALPSCLHVVLGMAAHGLLVVSECWHSFTKCTDHTQHIRKLQSLLPMLSHRLPC
jgi:predicted membrane channel-forming protein YqfA (hemolysin III family)